MKNATQVHIRPARPEEAGLFYAPHPEEDMRLGAVGCVRMAVQRQNMVRDKPLVGRVTYANGDTQEFTDAEAFLKCVRAELPYRQTTGFRYEMLTDDPTARKAVDDIVFDLYGEENPRQLEEYQKMPDQGMTMFHVYLAKEGIPNNEAYAKLDLPASPWELWDAMDKVRLQTNEGKRITT